MTDIEVIKRVRAGNNAAYEELVLKYEKRVFNTVMNMIKHEQDSMDITQNVFVKAYTHIGNFNDESDYFTYLFRIAINECKDYWKKASKKKNVSLYDEDGNPLEVADHSANPEEMTEANELKLAVNQEIYALSPEYRDVVLLRGIYGLSYEEIASVTGVDIGTVKSRLHRGREKVREALKLRNLL